MLENHVQLHSSTLPSSGYGSSAVADRISLSPFLAQSTHDKKIRSGKKFTLFIFDWLYED
jgi:hypothetical protein